MIFLFLSVIPFRLRVWLISDAKIRIYCELHKKFSVVD